MLYNEAQWLSERLGEFDIEKISPFINLGSSTAAFREKGHPFVSQSVIRPLERRGCKIVHVDMKGGDGVDIVGDIFEEATYERICSFAPRAVMCSNVLEHVADPGRLARRCVEMVPPNGLIFATVPYSLPYHPCPIDTMYRPSCEHLAKLFLGCRLLTSELVVCESFGKQLRSSAIALGKHLLHLALPWPTLQHWKSALHKNLWLFRNYEVSCVVLERC